jgi:hypothetical protein
MEVGYRAFSPGILPSGRFLPGNMARKRLPLLNSRIELRSDIYRNPALDPECLYIDLGILMLFMSLILEHSLE